MATTDVNQKYEHEGLEYINNQINSENMELIPQLYQSLFTLINKTSGTDTTGNANTNFNIETANIRHKLKLVKSYILSEYNARKTTDNNQDPKQVNFVELLSKSVEEWEVECDNKIKELNNKKHIISLLQNKITNNKYTD
ncbi:Cse2p SCDLUD_001198 [Saccharomycodes ludwigii]|uniref:Cse2p n=1 Tax=Saccharomycodes ludwigii TaxID=36035 RepID=UPI001E84D16C|nr:hypothetical protein SCDLUD_001198 [Saccharomycodes ludwigii]KAH3903556.1 hypothetical protein SCDLUD_001198 [Saccharomycodes ludwigii]